METPSALSSDKERKLWDLQPDLLVKQLSLGRKSAVCCVQCFLFIGITSIGIPWDKDFELD